MTARITFLTGECTAQSLINASLANTKDNLKTVSAPSNDQKTHNVAVSGLLKKERDETTPVNIYETYEEIPVNSYDKAVEWMKTNPLFLESLKQPIPKAQSAEKEKSSPRVIVAQQASLPSSESSSPASVSSIAIKHTRSISDSKSSDHCEDKGCDQLEGGTNLITIDEIEV